MRLRPYLANQFSDSSRTHDSGVKRSGPVGGIAFIGNFNQNIFVALVQNPLGCIGDGIFNGSLTIQPLNLPEVKIANNRDHALGIESANSLIHSGQVSRFQAAISVKSRVVPSLIRRTKNRVAALKVERDRKQTLRPPAWERRHKLICLPRS